MTVRSPLPEYAYQDDQTAGHLEKGYRSYRTLGPRGWVTGHSGIGYHNYRAFGSGIPELPDIRGWDTGITGYLGIGYRSYRAFGDL